MESPRSVHTATLGQRRIRSDQNDGTRLIGYPEGQTLRLETGDVLGRQIGDRQDLSAREIVGV